MYVSVKSLFKRSGEAVYNVKKSFDYNINDSQGIFVESLPIKKFDLEKYYDYELSLNKKCKNFWNKKEGVAVYRRFRIPQVFTSPVKK